MSVSLLQGPCGIASQLRGPQHQRQTGRQTLAHTTEGGCGGRKEGNVETERKERKRENGLRGDNKVREDVFLEKGAAKKKNRC